MKDTKIYTLDYLSKIELTEDDLHNIFDKSSFELSLVNGMIDIANIKSKSILNECTSINNWNDKYYWTKSQRNKFRNKLIGIMMNVYQVGPVNAESKADIWLLMKGLRVKNNDMLTR